MDREQCCETGKCYTVVRIESGDGSIKSLSHVQTDQCDLDIFDLGQMIKQALLGFGYHWDNVQDLFGDSSLEFPLGKGDEE